MAVELPGKLAAELEQIGRSATFLSLFLTNGAPASGVAERMAEQVMRMQQVIPQLRALGDVLVRVEPRIRESHMDMIADVLGPGGVPDTPEGLDG